MKRIYYLSTCDTCARIMQETGTVGFEVIDIKTHNIEADDLDRLKQQFGSYEALFNKRARKIKSTGLVLSKVDDLRFRSLILDEYSFLKRPVYIIDEMAFAGNSKSTVEAIKSKLGE